MNHDLEQAANPKDLSHESLYRPTSGNNTLEVPTIGDMNLPQFASSDAQPIITLQYTDRHEAIRALRVDDYAIALETIRNALRTEWKYGEHSPETTGVIDALWTIYHEAVEDLPEEL